MSENIYIKKQCKQINDFPKNCAIIQIILNILHTLETTNKVRDRKNFLFVNGYLKDFFVDPLPKCKKS